MDRAAAEAIYDAGREACVEFLLELTSAYEAQIAALEERIRRLEEQARRDSRTSSKPPSQDPPRTRQQRRAEARAKAKELLAKQGDAERKVGGQEGHRGAGRELAPEEQVDEIVAHYPQACGGCGREFSEDERRPGGRFGRHQVCELPPISAILIEHRTHRLRCPECRARTTAQLPVVVAGSAFGATVARGDRDADRPQPDLPAGDRGAGGRAVRRPAVEWQRGRDLPARQRRALRPAQRTA